MRQRPNVSMKQYQANRKQQDEERLRWAANWAQQYLNRIHSINETKVTADTYRDMVESDGQLMAEAIAETNRKQFKKAGLTSTSLLETTISGDIAKFKSILKQMKQSTEIGGYGRILTIGKDGKVVPIK